MTQKPTHYDELFPGRFLKAGLFKGRPVTLRIRDVDVEALPTDKGKDKVRGVISFDGTDKQLVLNSTNGQCIRSMFGKGVREWIGKRVTFVPETDMFGSKRVDAIRVKGSPDLEEDITVMIELPRKKAKPRKLYRTESAGRPSAPELDDDTPPEAVNEDGEVL